MKKPHKFKPADLVKLKLNGNIIYEVVRCLHADVPEFPYVVVWSPTENLYYDFYEIYLKYANDI